jgi:hypothetical protein
MGKVFLLGRDRNIWNDGNDLVALKSRTSSNRFSAWIVDNLTPLFHYFIGRHIKVSKHAASVPIYDGLTVLATGS